jgi:hypothetical protein
MQVFAWVDQLKEGVVPPATVGGSDPDTTAQLFRTPLPPVVDKAKE